MTIDTRALREFGARKGNEGQEETSKLFGLCADEIDRLRAERAAGQVDAGLHTLAPTLTGEAPKPAPAAPSCSGPDDTRICHAPGDKCLGCDHYYGKAPVCKYAPAPSGLVPRLRDLRERWLSIVRSKKLGDQLDGDFDVLDEVLHTLNASAPSELTREEIEMARTNGALLTNEKWVTMCDLALRALDAPDWQAGWIPTNERMPDFTGMVLVAWNKGCNGGTGMETVTTASLKALARCASDQDDDTFITHWRPLPAAPSAAAKSPHGDNNVPIVR